jgi:hypothetical protein
MRFLSTLTLCLAASVSAAPILAPRAVSTATLSSDITAIDNNVKTLMTAVKSYTGGLFGIIQLGSLVSAFNAVHSANRNAYSDAQSISSTLSVADSTSLVNLVTATLMVDNPAAVELMKTKKNLFAQSLLTGVIENALETLLDDHTSLSAALVKWVAPNQLSAANKAVKVITDSLESAVDYYN